MNRALIWAIHRTEAWWTYVGANLGFDHVTVLTDKRNHGDRAVTDDFYAAYRRFRSSGTLSSPLLSEAEVADVIARCRVLRWLPPARATAMALAMAEAMDRVLLEERPDAVLSFPIDSYVSDVLARRARAGGVPYFELTASALPDMSMLIHRGRLITAKARPTRAAVRERIDEIADPQFTPAYVQGQPAYTIGRFYRTLAYFRTRAAWFRLWSWISRDPLNLHYLDAQPSLGHKARLRDARIVGLVDRDWEARMDAVPKDRRVLFGLQLFPEAAIDYWIEDLALVDHETMLVQLATSLNEAGFQVVVKDHPLQFGFRQTHLLDALRALPNVVVVPYEVSGNAMLSRCGASVTATGTLGLQAALLGNHSIACEAYYVTEGDFIVIRSSADVAGISRILDNRPGRASPASRQARIIENLLRGSFDADFFSFKGFDPAAPNPAAAALGVALGERIRALGPEGEDWHGRFMPRGGGRHPGSPLN